MILHWMSPDGMRVLDECKEIVRYAANLPMLDGQKMYKRNGWYYVFASFSESIIGNPGAQPL